MPHRSVLRSTRALAKRLLEGPAPVLPSYQSPFNEDFSTGPHRIPRITKVAGSPSGTALTSHVGNTTTPAILPGLKEISRVRRYASDAARLLYNLIAILNRSTGNLERRTH